MGGAQRPSGRPPVAAKARAWRSAPSLPTVAAVLGCVVLALAIVYFWLAGLAHQLTTRHILVVGTLVVAFGGVGVVVARRQPGNRLGWILLGLLLVLGLGAIADSYEVLDYRLGHHGLPLGPVAVVLANTVQLLALLSVPLIILLFPDGRLTGQRWRWVLWAYAGLVAAVMAVAAANAIAPVAEHDIRIDSSGNLTSSGHLPAWLANPPVWIAVVVVVGLVGILLSAVGRQVLSWRRATGERRQQLKWLAFGAAVAVVWLIAMLFSSSLPMVGIAALPVSMGIAILKYRLYDIDRIISRTLAYAIVTGLLVGAYAGLVLLATRVLSVHTPVAVAAATLAAAALFNPLRRQVQRWVDRRFNRARYDADQTVAAFAARLKDAVDLDSVRDDLAGVVQQALEPAHLSVWVSRRG
jgi:MFS family permease